MSISRPLRSLRRAAAGRCVMRARDRVPGLGPGLLPRRLIAQRGASARTVEAYRDAFELLFGYLEQRTGKPPSALDLADLDAPRYWTSSTTSRPTAATASGPATPGSPRSTRSCATPHSATPPHADHRPGAGDPGQALRPARARYLSREQVDALLAAPDHRTWSGRRERCCSPLPTTPVPASPNSPACEHATCCWTGRPPCTCTARAASNASSRYGRTPQLTCAAG